MRIKISRGYFSKLDAMVDRWREMTEDEVMDDEMVGVKMERFGYRKKNSEIMKGGVNV